jgi:hypothetical protein
VAIRDSDTEGAVASFDINRKVGFLKIGMKDAKARHGS